MLLELCEVVGELLGREEVGDAFETDEVLGDGDFPGVFLAHLLEDAFDVQHLRDCDCEDELVFWSAAATEVLEAAGLEVGHCRVFGQRISSGQELLGLFVCRRAESLEALVDFFDASVQREGVWDFAAVLPLLFFESADVFEERLCFVWSGVVEAFELGVEVSGFFLGEASVP